MKKITFLLAVLFCTVQFSFAQSPTLVEDYILGPQGSADGRIYNFKNTLVYEGTSQNGMQAILQYDKTEDKITVVATADDFIGEINRVLSYAEEIIVLTRNNGLTNNIYRTTKSDFSDLQNIYSAGENTLGLLRIDNSNILLSEFNIDGTDYKTDIKLVEPDGTISVLYEDLAPYPLDFLFSSINGHLIISHKTDLINGKSIIAYNIETKQIVPITDIVPEYQDCGFIQQFGTIGQSIFFYQCDEYFIYDLNSNQFIEYEGSPFFLNYDTEKHLFLTTANDFFKIDKSTNVKEAVVSNIKTIRGDIESAIILSENASNALDISYFNYEEEKLYTFQTEYPSDSIYRMTGFGNVPSGVHTVIYNPFADNGIISKINSESYSEIDSVFNVTFNNRPVAYDEDIYFTHQDPIVGNELFLIDYDINSTHNFINAASIKISPNPAQAFINIEHAIDLIPLSTSIFDSNGSFVLKKVQGNKIDIRSLTSGIYTLRTSYDNGKLGIERFVVK